MELKKSIPLLLMFILLFSIVPAFSAGQTQSYPEIKVYIDVEENGNATVYYNITGSGTTSFWIFLPKNETIVGRAFKGTFSIVNHTSSYYFYYNSTISVAPGEDNTYSFQLSYKFPFASIMAGYNGWFMSPALLAEPDIEMTVYVQIPNLKRITLEEPQHIGTKNGQLVYSLQGQLYFQLGGRIIIEYDMAVPAPVETYSKKFDGTTVKIEYPVYYLSFAEKTADIIGKALKYYFDIFSIKTSELEFRFYLPKQALGGISTLGFVRGSDINVGGKGPIQLNLALMRYAPGYHETTVLHEMVHLFLGKLGVEANNNVRWFHEGMAQYISLYLAEKMGFNVRDLVERMDNLSKTLYDRLGGKIGFIEDWPSGDDILEPQAYLASYYIIKTLADQYGGIEYIKKVCKAIKGHGGVSSTQDIVDVLSEAAGRDLSGLFTKWGFHNISPWNNPKEQEQQKQQEENSGEKGEKTNILDTTRGTIITIAVTIAGAAAFIVYVMNTRIIKEIEFALSAPVVPEEK